MVYKVITDWIKEKIDLLNSTLSAEDILKESNVNFDMDFLPANMKDNSYLVKLSNVKYDDSESGEITVNAIIEFHFRLYKKPLEFYRKLIDEKLFSLCKILSGDDAGLEYESGGITIANIHKISINGMDKAYKGGEYIFPKGRI